MIMNVDINNSDKDNQRLVYGVLPLDTSQGFINQCTIGLYYQRQMVINHIITWNCISSEANMIFIYTDNGAIISLVYFQTMGDITFALGDDGIFTC